MRKQAHAKQDNSHFEVKLALRRYFLQEFHPHGASVLDCCCGEGRLWSSLRVEFPGIRYWGVDIQPKTGRLRIDSVRLLQAGATADIVDIDTYGNPYPHALALLPHIVRPMTLFLTDGLVQIGGGGGMVHAMYPLLNLCFKDLQPPDSLVTKFRDMQLPTFFRALLNKGIDIIHAREGFPQSRARYFGLHVRPRLKTKKEE